MAPPMQPASLSTLLHGHKQHLASTGLDFMCMCRSCSHYLMWSQCEPSQSWNAASVQEGLTWIDGKNGTQIIKRGHPHVTKKVMHIKITHLFELYISARAVNREPPNTRRISKSFHWFFKGIKSATSFGLMCCVLTSTPTHFTLLHVYKSGGPTGTRRRFLEI